MTNSEDSLSDWQEIVRQYFSGPDHPALPNQTETTLQSRIAAREARAAMWTAALRKTRTDS